MLFLLSLLSIHSLKLKYIITTKGKEDLEVVEAKDSLFSIRNVGNGFIGSHSVEYKEQVSERFNGKDKKNKKGSKENGKEFLVLLNPGSERSRFVRKMTSYIYSNIGFVQSEKEYCFVQDVRNFLFLTFDHFINKSGRRYNEMAIFLANAYHNTSYLTIFIDECIRKRHIKKEKGTDFSRGLLQIIGKNNYSIANKYKGDTDFECNPEKMAYLTADSINATLFFWEHLINELVEEKKEITFDNVLNKLNPEEVQGNNRENPKYHTKLVERRTIYNEVLRVIQYYEI